MERPFQNVRNDRSNRIRHKPPDFGRMRVVVLKYPKGGAADESSS